MNCISILHKLMYIRYERTTIDFYKDVCEKECAVSIADTFYMSKVSSSLIQQYAVSVKGG